MFTDSAAFDTAFNLGIHKQSVDRDMLTKAHYMLRPFILRRLKTEVEKALPPKLETKILCPMSEMQVFWIRSLLLKEKEALQKISASSDMAQGSEWKKLNSLMAQLRKAANHPYLFEGAEPPTLDGRAGADIITASGKMVVLDKLLAKLKERGHRVVLFSQYTRTLDIISDYLVYRGYDPTCRLDGQTNRVMREVYINMFNKKDSKKFIFLLSTRAGGEGVNLYTADTVILFDSDWNPQVDIQAMARVHRIGQTKPVHVYRLVSSGSVEERIVQRAQKKLFLDTMVNRGSTASSKLLDAQMQAEGEDDDDKKDDVEPSRILSALKFGWNSIFSVNNQTREISDEEIDMILDRSRGLSNDAAVEVGQTTIGQGLIEGIQSTVDDFDETMPLAPIRDLEPEDVPQVDAGTSIKAIGQEWKKLVLPDGSKRRRKRRTHEVNVQGVGMVQVLNQDDYTLEHGEPSVFEKEVKQKVSAAPKGVQTFVPTSGRQVAGRDYHHQDFCLECWDGGELVLCDICPAAFHLQCLGLKALPSSMQWQCPHHVCRKCHRKSSAAGLLFRCESCPSAYCEDCLPPDHMVTGDCERLNRLGFRLPGSACYILCKQECIDFYNHLSKTADGEIVPASKHKNQNFLKKLQNASKLSVVSTLRGKEFDADNADAAPAMEGADPVKAIGMCQLGDIKIRLLRNNNARFETLSEINGFEGRWRTATIHTKTIFSILINSIVSLFDSHEIDESHDVEEYVFAYKGCPKEASTEAIYKAFLNTTRRLTEIHKGKIVEMLRMIGVAVISALKRAPKDTALPPSSVEPKFKQVDDQLPRRCLEEVLAAFLVLPHPQNLIMAAPIVDDKSCSTCPDLPLPLGSTMYVARLVEALGDRIFDQNRKFFTALSVREGDSSSFVAGWNEVYATGKEPFLLSEVRKLLAPVKRLHLLQKDAIPRSVRVLLDEFYNATGNSKSKQKYDAMDEDDPKRKEEYDSDYTNGSPLKEPPPKEKKKKREKSQNSTRLPYNALTSQRFTGFREPAAMSMPYMSLPFNSAFGGSGIANAFPMPFLNPLQAQILGMNSARVMPTINGVVQLEDFSKVAHLLHEWISPIKQVPASSSGFVIQVSNFTLYDWSIGRNSVEVIRSSFTPYEGLHSRMRYPKFALQLQQLNSNGPLIPIDEHVELVFILIFKFFAMDFLFTNAVEMALDRAQEESYLVPGESILSPAIVSIMRSAECFKKLFGVVVEKLKTNIRNRIQNLGEGPTQWLHEETIAQLRETIISDGKESLSLREGQFLSYKNAGPGINFRCSQTVIEAISCSLGQFSLTHEIKGGLGELYLLACNYF